MRNGGLSFSYVWLPVGNFWLPFLVIIPWKYRWYWAHRANVLTEQPCVASSKAGPISQPEFLCVLIGSIAAQPMCVVCLWTHRRQKGTWQRQAAWHQRGSANVSALGIDFVSALTPIDPAKLGPEGDRLYGYHGAWIPCVAGDLSGGTGTVQRARAKSEARVLEENVWFNRGS